MNWGINPMEAPPIAGVGFYVAGYAPHALSYSGVPKTLSGALTANTYKEIFAYTGAGRIENLILSSEDSTSRTLGLKVVIDGVTFHDVVSAAATNSGFGCQLIGGSYGFGTQPFGKSISISIKSSLSETDKLAWGLKLVKVA